MRMNVKFKTQDEDLNVKFDEIDSITLSDDYVRLRNKPSVNGVELIGNRSLEDLGLDNIHYGTKEQWDAQPDLIAKQSDIYVYSDYVTIGAIVVPGIKIGNGVSRLQDLPFVTDIPCTLS